jgi:integrase
MPRPRKAPAYSLHAATGQARVTWTDDTGTRHDILLPGAYNSEESLAEYGKLLLQVKTSPLRHGERVPAGITVAELLLAFLKHADTYYRDADGKPGKEIGHIKIVARVTRDLYGATAAAEFGPLALKAVRQKMVDAGWCRLTVNQRVEKLKRMFRWAASEELVPAAVYEGLRTVAGLRKGKTEAPEPGPVTPADPGAVDATAPFLNRHVRAMVELQRLTGMRPGEVCRLRLADIDQAGELWVYRPARHKTAHRGRERAIVIGPKGQALIEEFIAGGSRVDPSAPLFSPCCAREERFADLRARRKSKVPPSQRNRRKRMPRLLHSERYTPPRLRPRGPQGHRQGEPSGGAGGEEGGPGAGRHPLLVAEPAEALLRGCTAGEIQPGARSRGARS